MRRLHLWMCAVSFVVCAAGAPGAWAQTPQADVDAAAVQAIRQDIDQLRKEFEARLALLESRLVGLGGVPDAIPPLASAPPVVEVPAGAAGAGAPSGALPVYGAVTASKIFNPDIAVIGNFLGTTGANARRPGPSLEMAESEVSLQAVVDPYARADFFLAFGEEGVDLEEGYLTLPTLPGGLLAKIGRQRAAFGRINTAHTHQVPWADRPLVTENLVGGAEGLSDAGLSLARLIPNPWIYLEATGQVFRGDAGEVFVSHRRSAVSYTGRLRGYADVSDSANVDVGVSYASGHNGSGIAEGLDLTTRLYGVDATVRWRPLRRALYRSFTGRAEIVWSRNQQPDGAQHAMGYFVSGDYQLARRWFTGVRFDRSGRAMEAWRRDTGGSWTLTYWPSEFSEVRGQLRRTRYAEGVDATEVLFQFMFNIGVHGAHPF